MKQCNCRFLWKADKSTELQHRAVDSRHNPYVYALFERFSKQHCGNFMQLKRKCNTKNKCIVKKIFFSKYVIQEYRAICTYE